MKIYVNKSEIFKQYILCIILAEEYTYYLSAELINEEF